MRMHQEGEAIQNGLLQKSFIIRRYLELASSNCAENQPQENQLIPNSKLQSSFLVNNHSLSSLPVDYRFDSSPNTFAKIEA